MKKRLTNMVLAVLLFAGCSSMQTVVEKQPDADFSSYRTWDWYPQDPSAKKDPSADLPEDLRNYIRSTVEASLAGRGLEHSGFSPDLYVDFQVTVQDVDSPQVINEYYGQDYYSDVQFNLPTVQTTYGSGFEQGALVLMMFDAKSKQIVWRGIASTEVNSQGPRKEARERIDKAVEKLTDKLPKK